MEHCNIDRYNYHYPLHTTHKKMKNLKEKFQELKTAVNESAQLTKNQVDSIKFQNPLTIIISIAVSLGLVYWLKIAVYWIPASFLIMYLWGLKGLKSSKKSFEPEKVEQSIQIRKVLKQQQISHGVDWLFTNLSNFAKATAIIYGISLFIILAINQNWIESTKEVPMLWPILSMIIYLPLPFLLNRTSKFIKNIIDEPFQFLEIVRDSFGRKGLSFILGILKAVFIVLIILGSLLAPVIALIQTLGLVQDWLFFVIVVILQFISIMIISSYYSSQTASKQLTNTLTNYADINYQINHLLMYDKADEVSYKKLRRLYLTAKPYDLLIDDSMQFIQFYYLLMNRTYVNALGEENQKS